MDGRIHSLTVPVRNAAILVALQAASVAAAQEAFPKIPAVKLEKAPQIDGVISPGEWESASRIEIFTDPQTGKPHPDQTVAFLGYREDAIYVAFICTDARPDRIIAREIRPNNGLAGDDYVTFIINPLGSRDWNGRCFFQVSARGTQNEGISGGRTGKREWRGEWQAAAKRTETGYVVEMRIPWAVLNYRPGQAINMDIDLRRNHSSLNSFSQWGQTSVNSRNDLSGQWLAVFPPPPRGRRPWDALAYVSPEYDQPNFDLRAGADFRYRITNDFTGLFSAFPDFKNIENDVAGVDFTRTERFFGESRPFFQEGNGYFGFGNEYGFGTMFYSQRIREFDFGAKSFGQITPKVSGGVLATVEDGTKETTAVAGFRNQIDPNSSVALYGTALSWPGLNHQSFGGGYYKRFGNFWTELNLGYEKDQSRGLSDAGDVSFAYEAPRWFGIVAYKWIKPDFNPPLGFIPWVDRRGGYSYIEYDNFPRTGSLRKVGFDFDTAYYETYEGRVQQAGAGLSAHIITRNNVRIGANVSRWRYEDGNDATQGLSVRFHENNPFNRFGFYVETGERASEPSNFLSAYAQFRILPQVDLNAEQSISRFRGTDQLTVVGLSYQISPTRSLSGRLVSRNGDTNGYLAYRDAGAKGMETFVILGDPNAETWRTRIALKFVWAF
jgi:hypothetical protein